jgi:hypothetical protein
MPCHTTQTVTVALGKVDLDLFETALKTELKLATHRHGKRLYFGGTGREYLDTETGTVAVRDQSQVAVMKRAYSATIVKAQAKRHGWTLKETGPYQYEVVKR